MFCPFPSALVSSTKLSIWTAAADGDVVGGSEVDGGVEYLINLTGEQLVEADGVGGYVGDGLPAELQRGIVVGGTGVLDEE